jgi:hypothetical protein
MNDEQNVADRDQADISSLDMAGLDMAASDMAILDFDVDDAAIEIAAMGAGTIPTASVNMIPPNCCVERPTDIVVADVSRGRAGQATT